MTRQATLFCSGQYAKLFDYDCKKKKMEITKLNQNACKLKYANKYLKVLLSIFQYWMFTITILYYSGAELAVEKEFKCQFSLQ